MLVDVGLLEVPMDSASTIIADPDARHLLCWDDGALFFLWALRI